MKKVLFLLLASFLVLAACGNKEESKSEDKKETKSSSKDSKKNDEQKNKKDKKPLSDTDKLKKNIEKESVTLKELDFVNENDEIHITIEVPSAMSKKSTVQAMKANTADTLYAVKKTKLDFSTVDVYVSPPDEKQYAMTSRWTYDAIKEIDKDSVYTLPDEMEEKADGFMLNSYFR